VTKTGAQPIAIDHSAGCDLRMRTATASKHGGGAANKLGIDSKKYKVIELRLFALPFTFSYKGTTTSALATRRFTRLQLTSLYTLDRTRACLSPSHVRGTVARTCSSTLSRLSTLHRARCGNRNNTRHATTLRTKCTEHMIDEIS
jgi:hypothetical protein